MLLEARNAVIYGGGGAIGGAAARTFAREGATVFLAGRTASKLEHVAHEIVAAGGSAHVAEVDALDEEEVRRHLASVAVRAGGIDVSFNAVGMDVGEQGLPLVDMSADEFSAPLAVYPRTQFITAKAAARPMAAAGSGVILTMSAPMARMPAPRAGSYGPAYAAVENLSRQLAAELGTDGIRVVCLRPSAVPEAARRLGSLTRDIWARAAARLGVSLEELLDQVAAGSMLRRPLTVAQVAETAAFLASDRADGVTGTTVNVSCGSVVD